MTQTKHISTTQSKIETGKKVSGQIILTSDSQNMYWDFDNNIRIKITDVIDISNEAVRIAMADPQDKFYFVISTKTLWRFNNNTWTKINNDSSNSVIMSATEPVGQEDGDAWLEVLS